MALVDFLGDLCDSGTIKSWNTLVAAIYTESQWWQNCFNFAADACTFFMSFWLITSLKCNLRFSKRFCCHIKQKPKYGASLSIHNILKIRKYLDITSVDLFIHAFVLSRIDMCNLHLFCMNQTGCSIKTTNTASRIITQPRLYKWQYISLISKIVTGSGYLLKSGFNTQKWLLFFSYFKTNIHYELSDISGLVFTVVHFCTFIYLLQYIMPAVLDPYFFELT